MVIGERLRKLREGRYSQEDIASMLNVHNNTISKWENGTQEPRANRIAELAKILGTTSAYLLGDTDNPSTEQGNMNTVTHTRQQSMREHSVNNGMLVYETRDGERFEAPFTDEGIKYIERMRVATHGLTLSL